MFVKCSGAGGDWLTIPVSFFVLSNIQTIVAPVETVFAAWAILLSATLHWAWSFLLLLDYQFAMNGR